MATSATQQPDPGTPNGVPAPQPSAGGTNPALQPVSQPGANPAPSPTSAGANAPKAQGTAQQPTILTPVHTGFRGMLDRVLDAVAGNTKPQVYKDQDGNLHVADKPLNTSQKFGRILQLGIQGAARGAAAGRGAGNWGKALDAGVESGLSTKQSWDEAGQKADQQIKQKKLDSTNLTLLQQQIARNQFEATHAENVADEQDWKFAQEKKDALPQGSSFLGNYTFDNLHTVLEKDPDFWKHVYHVDGSRIEQIKHYGEDGKANGIDIYLLPANVNSEIMPAGTKFNSFTPPDDPEGAPSFAEETSSEPMSRLQLRILNDSAEQKRDQFMEARTKRHAEEQLGTQRGKKGEEEDSQTNLNNTRADNLENGGTGRARSAGAPGAPPTPQADQAMEDLAQAVYDGRLKVNDMKREAKGESLDPNKVIARAFAIARDKGENLNLTQIEQEDKFASSTRVQGVMDGIDRMLGTRGNSGYLDQMVGYARQAGLTGNAPYNVVSQGIRRWGGDAAAKNFETAVSETRRSIAGLIGNPLLGGSETDKKLEHANELLGKNPTLANIQSAVDILKTALTTQKQSMMGNNRYLRARYGTGQPVPQQQQGQQGQFSAVSSDGKWGWNGSAWVAMPQNGGQK